MSPRISLCMVARNEAAFIGQSIASAQPVVDEVIVVDAGSTDATPRSAWDAGATLVQAAWPGDLGTAHDLPAAHAGDDWVLALDADEVLDPSSADPRGPLTYGGVGTSPPGRSAVPAPCPPTKLWWAERAPSQTTPCDGG